MVDGKIDAMVKEIIQLVDVPAALMRISERHVQGKIVAKLL